MLKPLTLDSPVYKKFFEISDKVIYDINQNAAYLLPILKDIYHLQDLVYENSNYSVDKGEIIGRTMHYVILDNKNLVKDYFDDTEESKALQNTYLSVFEVKEINTNSAVLVDIKTGKEFTIVGEGAGSTLRIGKDIQERDLIISRLIKINNEWYIMKNFYYVLQSVQKRAFEEIKLVYKEALLNFKNMYDLEIVISEILEVLNSTPTKFKEQNINYAKKIRNILLLFMTKKEYKQAESILKEVNENTLKNFLAYIEKFDIPEKRKKELVDYVINYLNSVSGEKLGKSTNINNPEFMIRLQFVAEEFVKFLNEKAGQGYDIRKSEIFKKLKKEWFKSPNPLFGNRTPEEFLREIDPDYDIDNIQVNINRVN